MTFYVVTYWYRDNHCIEQSGDNYEITLTEAYAFASFVERMGGRVYSIVKR
jgi:hypothetical protein